MVSKKEKGTINSTQDSVKNHVQVTKYKTNSLQLVQTLEKNLNDLKFETNDDNILRIVSNSLSKIFQLKGVIKKDPRFPYQIIQNKIYEMYNEDTQITGATVDFIFKDLKYNLINYNPNVRAIFK